MNNEQPIEVWIIDDEKSFSDTLLAHLERHVQPEVPLTIIQIFELKDVNEFVQKSCKDKQRLIFCDNIFPEEGAFGFQYVIPRLRSLYPGAIIIAMTSKIEVADDANARQAFESEANFYIHKETVFMPRDFLLRKIKNFLQLG